MFISTTRKMAILALAAGLALPMTSLVHAEDRPALTPGNATPNSRANTEDGAQAADREFVTKAVAGGMLEVKLGELAQQKASAADVKQFGQHMVDDHGKANTELKQLAEMKNVPVATELKGDEKKMYDKMAALSGEDFDKQYITGMIRDHKDDIADFEKEAKEGKDTETKAWASKTLPTLKSHYEMIQQVAQSHGVDTARTAGDKQPADRDTANPGTTGNKPNNQGNTGIQPQQPGTTPQK